MDNVLALGNPQRVSNVTGGRAQHRQQNPKSPAHAEVDEAMARCVLFKNPGKYDVAFLKFYNQKSRLVMEKMRASVKPDSNAD